MVLAAVAAEVAAVASAAAQVAVLAVSVAVILAVAVHLAVGNIFGNFLAGALRNPAAAAAQVGNLFVGAALAEALGILAFVLGVLMIFG